MAAFIDANLHELGVELEEFDRRKDVNGSMRYWPVREGRVIHERPAA
jgi:hypothetical protein